MEPWRKIQTESFSNISLLADFLELDPKNRQQLLKTPSFPFLLPKRIASKIEKNNLYDPLALQFLPLKEELIKTQGFAIDPTCDATFRKGEKLLHKYEGRVLLVTTGACAMHCRYCFRQNFSYSGKPLFANELSYIANNPSLHEVILSGGDPLSLSDTLLESLLTSLDTIPHIRLIRFHTRFPIGIPERLSRTFINLLKRLSKQVIFVVHANHPREFDPDIFSALKSLSLPLLLQTVLLKGVNDTKETLHELFLTTAANGILPYYLHQLDPVQGTSHFFVPREKGLFLIEELRNSLPGYALPCYVQEVPNAPSKTPILSP